MAWIEKDRETTREREVDSVFAMFSTCHSAFILCVFIDWFVANEPPPPCYNLEQEPL